ncbi:MAG: phosphotransferase [Tepidisphaeraceae bacterium]
MPQWFRDLVRPTGPAGQPGRALVSFDADAQSLLADANGADGIVAVNGRGLSEAALHAAGFPYARRFAVVPDLARARWFIPLDSAAVASAGFALYSPAKLTARLKLKAVRLAARAGFRGWYRDEVWVAGRRQPPLEQLVRRVLPNQEIRLALSAGAPEPARNRKASVAVLGVDGAMLAFAKLPSSKLANQLVRQEAETLAALGERFQGDECPVPRLLYAGDGDGHYALIQAPLTGKPTSPRLTPAHRKFLDLLQSPADQKPAADSAFFKSLLQRVDALGDAGADLRQVLGRCAAVLARTRVPRTIIHGDFAPWNIRLKAGCETISAFDWEYGTLDGLPLIDESHFEIQVGLLLNDWPIEKAVRELELRATSARDFPADAVRALQAVYLIDSITRLIEEGYATTDEMIVWYRQVLLKGPGAATH